MLTRRNADYLETVYLLSLSHDTVGVSQVAAERGVTIPSARSAVRKLKTDGYVRQEHYGKVVLTERGRRAGTALYRAHTVLFRFLHDILRVERDRADREACRVEHDVSDDTLIRLVRFLDRAREGGGEEAARSGSPDGEH